MREQRYFTPLAYEGENSLLVSKHYSALRSSKSPSKVTISKILTYNSAPVAFDSSINHQTLTHEVIPKYI